MPPTMLLLAVWYGANLLFNVGMKRSHALLPDVMLLTSLQFITGALALGIAVACGAAQPSTWWPWRRQLAYSTMLLLGGTLCSNLSLVLLSVSFTHVIKTCEPFFAVVIVFAWDGGLPSRTATFAIVTTVAGVLVASMTQRASAGKDSDIGVGVGVALLANLLLQMRNVLNKRLLSSSQKVSVRGADSNKSDDESGSLIKVEPLDVFENTSSEDPESPQPLAPLDLLLVCMTAAVPLQLSLQATCCSVALALRTTPTESRYAHYGNAHPLWLLAPPVCFVGYQIGSIFVLSRVDPVMHAVLNSVKRIVVIGLGAMWMRETISVGFASGACLAIVGAATYSLAKVLRLGRSHSLLQLALVVATATLVVVKAGGLLEPATHTAGIVPVTTRGDSAGTPSYVAPTTARVTPTTARVDLYAPRGALATAPGARIAALSQRTVRTVDSAYTHKKKSVSQPGQR